MSPDSRIISAICHLQGIRTQLINVYAHSGSNMSIARDELFENDLMFFLRHNVMNCFMGGDWNCVTENKECTHFPEQKKITNPKKITKPS